MCHAHYIPVTETVWTMDNLLRDGWQAKTPVLQYIPHTGPDPWDTKYLPMWNIIERRTNRMVDRKN